MSKAFAPCRALGLVSNQVPLQVRYIKSRTENLIVTCVGKSFHTYGISHFSLLSVSGLHPCDIECMASDTYHVYTGAGKNIYAWRRGTELKHTYKGHKHDVKLLLPFGPHLISVDVKNNLKIWDIKDESVYSELSFQSDNFSISALMHPDTYINKILLGSEQGTLQLWNIKDMRLLYEFMGWQSPVTCITQSTAPDVVAVGLKDGRIVLHHLKIDQTIMVLTQEWGAVSSISFRRDGKPIMASGSVTGHIVLWDLDKKRVASQVLQAHEGSVTGMVCLHQEPLMLTSSPDNRLKLWIFDMPDDGARLLRIREGHSAPPTFVRFYDPLGDNLLSAGSDSTLRIFNTKTEQFNKSLGKASYNRKSSKKRRGFAEDSHTMPPIVRFAFETTREKEWDNIASLHSGLPMVTTWSYDKIRMGQLKLLPERLHKKNIRGEVIGSVATCLCMTKCGNFVLIGYSTGHVDRFNMQSGLWRENYGTPTAHDCAVKGVAVNQSNTITVTGSRTGELNFWSFQCNGSQPLHDLELGEPINFFRMNHENAMLAIAMEDFTINIVDVDTKKLTRKLEGHTGKITDLTVFWDLGWLISSSMDSTIKVWDIPSYTLIDQFATHSPCVSLDLSPDGVTLATSHVDYLGVFLWSNKSLFRRITFRAIDPKEEAPLVQLPDFAASSEEGVSIEEAFGEEDEEESHEQISEELITLSGLPTARWMNLLDLDQIKERNKLEQPKEIKAAPFFIPTIPSIEFKFDLANGEENNNKKSKIVQASSFKNRTAFGDLLSSTAMSEDYESVLTKLKTFGLSATEFEIKSLAGDSELLEQFLRFMQWLFSTNKDYELATAYFAEFLKYHMEEVVAEVRLQDVFVEVEKRFSEADRRLEDIQLSELSIMDFFMNY